MNYLDVLYMYEFLYFRLQAFASSETIQDWLQSSRPSQLKQSLLRW